jgi:glutamate dehydrogenase
MEKALASDDRAQLELAMHPYVESGFPTALAKRIAMLPMLFPALDVVETAAQRKTSAERVSRIYFGLGEVLDLKWLRAEVEALKRVHPSCRWAQRYRHPLVRGTAPFAPAVAKWHRYLRRVR